MPHKDPDARRACARRISARRYARLRAAKLAEKEARISARPKITPEDAAWFAGMFEGEGTVSINRVGQHFRCICTLTNTDREIVDAFQAQWPGWIVTPKAPRKIEHRAAYIWNVGAEQLVMFLEDVAPFFRTTSRRERAALVLECQRLRWTGQVLPDYRERITALYERSRQLNHRGAVPLAEAEPARRRDSAARFAA